MRVALIVPLLHLSALCIAAAPMVRDPRLNLSLFAADPDIVTPIGMAFDEHDDLLVLESHTHTPPANYTGPKHDRIKRFIDRDRDGKPEQISVFADNLDAGMNLAFSPDHQLYVVCARDVWRLEDRDKDGVAEARQRILRVDTSNTYPHSCLLGITFSRDGWLYVTRGNNGSAAYTIRGTDNSSVSGYGDGGNIVRCRPDGSQLQEVATGFWNPFDLAFDSFGRLLCIDNDPDARGPNRVVHVLPGGDYGYKSAFGGGGNHPFQAWNGELPGTLPFVAGTGEAPSGILDCALTALPYGATGDFLVTIWNENSIVRYSPQPSGATLKATGTLLIAGDKDFRPVAIAADRHGDVYFTDWVLVAYPNHGRGRIWKLTPKPGLERHSPRSYFDAPLANAAADRLQELARLDQPEEGPQLISALEGDDAFIRHTAVVALSQPALRETAVRATRHDDPLVRLGALLALRRARVADAQFVAERMLSDPDPDIRRMALIWAAETGALELRDRLDRAIRTHEVTPTLFETYLAAYAELDPAAVAARQNRRYDKANKIKGKLEPGLLETLALNTNRSVRIRSFALKRLPDLGAPHVRKLLWELIGNAPPRLQLEAVRSLAQHPDADTGSQLRQIALNTNAPVDVRAEALSGASWQHGGQFQDLIPLLNDPHQAIQVEAVRLLRTDSNPKVAAALQRRFEEVRLDPELPVHEQLAHTFRMLGSESGASPSARPDSPEAWVRALHTGGDIAAGERLFFTPQTSCSKCHTLQGRGGKLGPDLSNIGQSVTRAQIIRSIVSPSEQFPPQYQAWTVETKDGEIHQGLQLDHKANNAIELFTTEGKTVRFDGADIESYAASSYSLMPDGLETALTVEDFRHLAAFLESLK